MQAILTIWDGSRIIIEVDDKYNCIYNENFKFLFPKFTNNLVKERNQNIELKYGKWKYYEPLI